MRFQSIWVLATAMLFWCCDKENNEPEKQLSSEKTIESFEFEGLDTQNRVQTKKDNQIEMLFLKTQDLARLKPLITVSKGASIAPANQSDFTKPVTYTVTAEDKTTQAYQVSVYNQENVLSIKALKSDNPDLDKDYTLTQETTELNNNINLDQLRIKLEVADGFSVSPSTGFSLKTKTTFTVTSPLGAQFSINRMLKSIQDANPNPPTDPNPPTNPPTNPNPQPPTIVPTSKARIESFSFLAKDNVGIDTDIRADIQYTKDISGRIHGQITAAIPHTITVINVKPTATYSPHTRLVGQLPTSYTATKTLQLVNNNGTETDTDDSYIYYLVTITQLPPPGKSTTKQITDFRFEPTKNPGLTQDLVYSIDENAKTITTKVGKNFDLSILKTPTITHDGQRLIQPFKLDYNYSGYSFIVYAEDNSRAVYDFRTKREEESPVLSSEKQVRSLSFRRSDNAQLDFDYTATIDQTNKRIVLHLSDQIDLSRITPHITVSAKASVSPSTPQDFTSQVNYQVTAQDGTTDQYAVQVKRYKSFISTWNVTASNLRIKIPIYRRLSVTQPYDFVVDWGDGNKTKIDRNNINTAREHTYASAGEYTVTMTGYIDGFNFSVVGDSKTQLKRITQWGSLGLGNQAKHFEGVSQLSIAATDAPNLQGVSNMSFSFAKIPNLSINNLNQWNFSSVTDMSYLFYNSTNFNQPINNTTTSGVQTMAYMFAKTKFNSTLTINTVAVESMESMFEEARQFNQQVNFNTAAVTNMKRMFRNASAFNQAVSFDISQLETAQAMFNYATTFDSPLRFTGNATRLSDVSSMFAEAAQFNQTVSLGADPSKTLTLSTVAGMFTDAKRFNKPVNMNTQNVTNMSAMFAGSAFNQPITFNTAKVTTMREMFMNTPFNQTLPNSFVTSQVSDMSKMFTNNSQFNQPLSFDVGKVSNFDGMFFNATAFASALHFSNLGQTQATMNTMFYNARAFNHDISDWNVSKVSKVVGMFQGASAFSHTLTSWRFTLINAKGITDISDDFDTGAGVQITPQWGS